MEELKMRTFAGGVMVYFTLEDINRIYTNPPGFGLKNGLSINFPKKFQLYTNVKDGNGKEIYEGDCFKTSDKNGYSSNCIAEVCFNEGVFFVHIHRPDMIQPTYLLTQYLESYADSTDIIGNVDENPELLHTKKGSKE